MHYNLGLLKPKRSQLVIWKFFPTIKIGPAINFIVTSDYFYKYLEVKREGGGIDEMFKKPTSSLSNNPLSCVILWFNSFKCTWFDLANSINVLFLERSFYIHGVEVIKLALKGIGVPSKFVISLVASLIISLYYSFYIETKESWLNHDVAFN